LAEFRYFTTGWGSDIKNEYERKYYNYAKSPKIFTIKEEVHTMNEQKNVLLIEVDQMPWFCLSAFGSKNVRTPNIDRLVSEGIAFNDCTVQSPICMPSRLSMLAGKYPSTIKQFGFSGLCPHGTKWMHQVFADNNYATAAFGKFHVHSMGKNDWTFEVSAPTLGEDIDWSKPANNNYSSYCEANNIKWPTDQEHGHSPWSGNNQTPPRHAPAWATKPPLWCCQSEVPYKHNLENWTAEQCIKYLKDTKAEPRPFFIWLSFDRPHSPTTVPHDWECRIKPEDIILEELPDRQALCGMFREFFNDFADGTSMFNIGEQHFREVLASYFNVVELIDHEIGRTYQALKELNLLDNTTIVFTADHGDEAGFNGLFDKRRRSFSEAITRVPLIIAPAASLGYSGKNQGLCEAPVELVDLLPTLCTMHNLEIPSGTEGHDLCGYLKGESSLKLERPVFCEEYYRRMIRTGHYRMVFDRRIEVGCALHDLAADPNQFRNLYNDDNYFEIRIELKRQLLAFMAGHVFGNFNKDDVKLIEDAFDLETESLPLHSINANQNEFYLHFYRAALFIRRDPDYNLFVPFYDASLMLFQHGDWVNNSYPRRDQQIAIIPKVVEDYLDYALRKCMEATMPVGQLLPRGDFSSRPVSSQEEVDMLLSVTGAKLL
jgi:arylsulfatase A-like enzyme